MKNNNTPDSVQKLVGEEKINNVLDAIYFRLSGALTEKDLEEISNLDEKDSSGEKVQTYIQKKVPNIEEIIQEEVRKSKSE